MKDALDPDKDYSNADEQYGNFNMHVMECARPKLTTALILTLLGYI